MGKLGILTKVRMAIGILGAGYIALLLLVQWTASSTQKSMHVASEDLFPAALQSQEAEAGFQKLIKHYSDAVLMQDKGALSRADEAASSVASALQSVEQHASFDPQRQREVSTLRATFDALNSRSKSAYSAMLNAQGGISQETQATLASLAQDNKAMEAALREMRDKLSKDFEGQLNSVTSSSARQRTAGISMFLVTALCTILLTVMVERQVAGPLQRLTAGFQDIAEGDGDLTKRMPVTSEDEIGQLSHRFNTFVEKLHGIICQVAEHATQLRSASEELSKVAADEMSGADTQREQTVQMATAMQEMSSTVTEIAMNSEKASESAKIAENSARDGGKVVERTIVTMRSIAEAVSGSAKKIDELGRSSERIGNIVGVIDDIADQTNLLALNAAIEAARAGEQGRGFAVVADEVRKLAERTTAATKEIAGMIKGIQDETKKAVETMEAGTKQVDHGVSTATEAGSSLQHIIEMAEQVGTMVAQIATAASEQSKATEHISRTVDQISEISNDTAEGAKQSSKGCELVATLVAELEQLVSSFKLEQHARNVRRAENTLVAPRAKSRAAGAGA